jgi:hypothetical protein
LIAQHADLDDAVRDLRGGVVDKSGKQKTADSQRNNTSHHLIPVERPTKPGSSALKQ